MADRFLECDDVEQVKETEGYEGLFHLIEQTPVIYLKAFGPICEVGAESYSFLKPGKNIEEKHGTLRAGLEPHAQCGAARLG